MGKDKSKVEKKEIESENLSLHCWECGQGYAAIWAINQAEANNKAEEYYQTFLCEKCGNENDLKFSQGAIEVGLEASGKNEPFEVREKVNIAELTMRRVDEPHKQGREVFWNEMKWYFSFGGTIYRAVFFGLDASYIYYDYFAADKLTAQLRIHRKRGSIEQVKSYVGEVGSHHLAATTKFRSELNQIVASLPKSFEWLGE